MNTDNGALEFDTYFNNEKLVGSINEAEKRVKGFSAATVKEAEKIDDAFKITADNIRIQKDVIGQIETQLNNLNIEIAKMKPGTAQDQMKLQATQVAAELKAEKDALKMLEQQVKTTETAHVSFRTRLREMRDQMIEMETAGLRNTDAYRKLAKEAGDLKDSIGDAQAQMAAMANDEGGFRGVVSMVGGITGAMSAAQGAVGLFAGENENLNKIMLKVQSMMAITIGLQQVAEMLNKDSYFSVVILTKAKEMFAIAELKLAAAFGISTVAAQVLMATLTLGLSVAITAIIIAISKFSSKAADARKAQEEFNKAVIDSAIKPIAAIEQLSAEYSALGDNLKAKAQFVEDNAEKFNELGVAVNSVKDAENLLIVNKDRFIDAQIAKAKAMAATEMAAEKYKLALEKELELEEMKPGSRKFRKATIEKNQLETQGANLIKKSSVFTEQGNGILKEIGAVAYREETKTEKQAREEREKAEKDAEAKAKKDRETLLKAKEDFNNANLDSIKKAQEAENELIRSGIKDKKALIDFDLEQTLKAIDEQEKAFVEKAKKAGVKNPDVSSFNSMRYTAKGQAAVDKSGIDAENEKVEKEKIDGLLLKFQNMKQRMLTLEKDYNKDVEQLNKAFFAAKTKEEQDQIRQSLEERTKQYEKDKSGISVENLMTSPDWTKLFGDLETVSTKELLALRDKVESEFGNMNLAPEDLAELRDKVEQVTDQIQKRNPFLALSDALKKYKENEDGAGLKKVFESVAGSIDLVKGSFDAVVGSLDKMGIKTDANTKQVLGDISGMLGGASTAAMGIASGNPLQIIQGSIELISNGIDLIAGSKDRKLEQSIQRHAAEVEKLKIAYEDLERAIDGALGSDRYSAQKATIDNLKKQQAEYAAMARAEKDKKKTDDSKVKEYGAGIKSNTVQITEMINQIREDILTMDVSSAAGELGNAIIDAFAAGEDAAAAWGNKVDDIVGNVIRKMLIQKLVEEPVGSIINKYMSQWVDSNGNFLGFDAVMSSAQAMGGELKGVGSSVSAVLENLPDDIKKYFTGDSAAAKGMSGAIKGASEESISMLSGYANAIRINQIESVAVLRNQLLALDRIAANTAYNVNLLRLNDILDVLKVMSSSDPLRSKGLGG